MVFQEMANVLKQLIEGKLDVEVLKKQLTDGKLQGDGLGHPSFKTTEFVQYFLNYIREESANHFTSDLPVISPKKIKKKKRSLRHCTPTSDTSNDSTKSSARESLFSSPPSGKVSNVTLSPVGQGRAQAIEESPNRSGSPLAIQHSRNSLGSGEASKVLLVTSTPVKFNLEDDFPPVSLQNTPARKRSTPTRRITPTPARGRRNSSNLFNSFTFESSFESERSFSGEKLKQRHKYGSSSDSPKNARKSSVKLKLEDFMNKGSRHQTPTRYQRENVDGDEMNSSNDTDRRLSSFDVSESKSFNNSREQRVLPKSELVTERYMLQKLADVHSFCILENLVPNMVVEVCFVLQLLTMEGKSDQGNGHATSEYLKTIHNCVFYAVHVLEKLYRIIKLLDKGTLRLLLDNARIIEFSSSFNEELKKIYPTISINKVPYSLLKSPLNSVPFQASVDNRNNFSSDQAFHCFKRQRDTFYEIVREWEEMRGKPGWSLEEKLGEKIRYVVHQKSGLATLANFVRLFQSQLIQMCCHENILPTFNEGESLEFVGNLFRSNPEKFFRLQQRLVAPQSTTAGACPSPGFTETEEFFREFIVAATSSSFNRYLMDSFIVKIIELNAITLHDDLDISTETESKEEESSKLQVKFASCVITLRTLAKFLGFLVFSPYHNSVDVPTTLKNTLVSARNQVTQPIDIMFHLRKARDEQRLVLTLPWVIEYLSMMDGVCPFLDYYVEVFEFLHHIYRKTLGLEICRNSLMLSVGLGWLFEMPVIPDTMFTKSSEKISWDCAQTNSSSALDKMDLVDQHLLYTCCPYLGELRSILAEAVIGKANKRGYMKKIKPICADRVETSPSSCSLLQTQLEDNFFRNQPECLKKDVDFIITRIYLNMVSMVKNCVIPSEIEQTKGTLITESTFNIRNWREVNKEEFKDGNKVLLMKLCDKTVDGVLARISSDISKECKSRSFNAVQSLSPHDMNEAVVKTASGIVHQSAMKKLTEWSHQNLSVMIEKVVRKDMDKMITREQNAPINIYRAHAEDTDHPFNWFYQKLLDKSQESEKSKTQATIEQSNVGELHDHTEQKTKLEDEGSDSRQTAF